MLVLSRKPGEKILIGEEITLTIVRIGPNTVRLGIEAPRGMNIVREELTFELPADPDQPHDARLSEGSQCQNLLRPLPGR